MKRGTPYVGTLTWSWDFRDARDRGHSTESIFEYNYPRSAITPEQLQESISYAVKRTKEWEKNANRKNRQGKAAKKEKA